MVTKVQNVMEEARNVLNNERGAQTIEWVALALVILFLMAAVATAMEGNGGNIAGEMVSKISELIKRVGNE